MPTTFTVLPISDAGPNQYSPTPGTPTHAFNVDEEPHDGDGSYLSPTAAGQRESFLMDLSAIPSGWVVSDVMIRTVEKGTTAGSSSFRAGLTIGGVDYPQSTHGLAATIYNTFDDDLGAVSPASGVVFTLAELAAAEWYHEQVTVPAGNPKPRLTEFVGFVLAEEPPVIRPEAEGTASAPTAAGAASGPTGTGAAVGPSGAGAVASPVASGAASGPTASGAPSGPSATAAARGTSASGAESKPTATCQAIGPNAGGAAVSPAAAATVLPGATGEGA